MPDLSTYLRQSSLTYSDVVADLTNYVNSLPDGSKPKDLFLGSEGKLIIDYLAAEHSDIAYKIIMGFCENYLLYANKLENIIANAESKGFNALRGTNATLNITYISAYSNPIGYLDQVGTIEDYGIYSLEDRDNIHVGDQITLKCVIGTRKDLTYTVNDPEQLVYRFTEPKVSDHLRIYIDSVGPINYTTNPVEALYGKLCVMTNSYGSIDLLDFSSMEAAQDYIENKDYQILQQSTIQVQYIEYATIKYEGAIGTFTLGSLSNLLQTSVGTAPSTPVEIQKNAMLWQQTQARVVARRDYKKVTQLHVPGIMNVNDMDYSPATVAVTYVTKDGMPMTKEEYDDLIVYLNKTRTAGIPLPYIVPSNAVTLILNAHVSLLNYVDASVLTTKIQKEYDYYTYQPGIELPFNDLEENCEQLENVQVVRYSFNSIQFPAGQYCPLGTVIQPGNGNAYIACTYAYSTGDDEPTWPTTLGTYKEDGTVKWMCVPFEEAPYWEPAKVMNEGQIRLPSTANGFAYEIQAASYYTGSVEPEGEGYDGDIYWRQTIYDSTAPMWQADTEVNYGDIYNFTTVEGYSFVASGVRKRAPITEPEWTTEDSYQLVGDILFMRVPLEANFIAKDAVLSMPWNSYLVMTCNLM